jgi:1,4-dihydroxy-2-naphthoyl-CoA synthase
MRANAPTIARAGRSSLRNVHSVYHLTRAVYCACKSLVCSVSVWALGGGSVYSSLHLLSLFVLV